LRQQAQDAMDFMRASPATLTSQCSPDRGGIESADDRAAGAATWTTFLTALAEVDSRVMRHCLYLVQRHYTEPRLLELNGHMGWANVNDFRGVHLMGQCSVRVDASSLENRTRDQIKADIQFWQTVYPGAVPPRRRWPRTTAGSART
jgi:hypothetical protein